MTDHKIFTTDIDIRFRDLDSMGHVNNAVMFTYFEHGRVKFFHSEPQNDKFSGFTFILAHISCNYIKPVTLDDRLSLRLWIKEIGSKSFTFYYQMVDRFDSSIIYATGESVQVCFDYQKNDSLPVPDEIKVQLSKYLKN